jgi:hypothetical protein
MLLYLLSLLLLNQLVCAGNIPSTILQWAMTPSPMNPNTALGRYLIAHPLDLDIFTGGVITATQAGEIAADLDTKTINRNQDKDFYLQLEQCYAVHFNVGKAIREAWVCSRCLFGIIN